MQGAHVVGLCEGMARAEGVEGAAVEADDDEGVWEEGVGALEGADVLESVWGGVLVGGGGEERERRGGEEREE